MKGWWRYLLRYARPHAAGLALVLGTMLVVTALEALRPWPLKLLVDSVLGDAPLPAAAAWIRGLPGAGLEAGLVAWLAGATVAIFLGVQTLRIAQGYVEAGIGNRMVYALGADFFDHLQRLSLGLHSRWPRGDLVRRVTTDTRCVRGLVLGVGLPVVTSLATLGVMFAVMWRLDPMLSLVAVAVAGPLAWVVRRLAGPMADREWRYQEAEGGIMAQAERTLGALPVVKVFRREPAEEDRFRGLAGRGLETYGRSLGSQLRFQFAAQGVTAFGVAAVMVVGGLHVLQGQLSIGSLLVFLSYLASLYAPMETLAYLSSGFASAAANARRVFDLLESDEGVREREGAVSLPDSAGGPRGRISFEGVSFAYQPGRFALSDVSLEVSRGETLAIVGPTGAGKTTLVSLVARLFDPQEGSVRLDGVDLRDLRLESLRANVALVLQDCLLLPGTVAENIAYGDPGASSERIVAAAVAADADGFVRALPNGYASAVGERGAKLSGGQRQRLAIARALLKDAPVLILDEPTSALDTESETALLRVLGRLCEGRTTLVIAHRLSTIRSADRIVFLQDGRIVECGTHDELMARRSAYRAFYALQLGNPEPDGGIALAEVRP